MEAIFGKKRNGGAKQAGTAITAVEKRGVASAGEPEQAPEKHVARRFVGRRRNEEVFARKNAKAIKAAEGPLAAVTRREKVQG